MYLGILAGLAGSWGYNGVFWFALVRAYPESPGRLTGAMAPGGLAGSTLGPLTFGWIAEIFGYPTMWVGTAILTAMAATSIWLVGPRVAQATNPNRA